MKIRVDVWRKGKGEGSGMGWRSLQKKTVERRRTKEIRKDTMRTKKTKKTKKRGKNAKRCARYKYEKKVISQGNWVHGHAPSTAKGEPETRYSKGLVLFYSCVGSFRCTSLDPTRPLSLHETVPRTGHSSTDSPFFSLPSLHTRNSPNYKPGFPHKKNGVVVYCFDEVRCNTKG